MQIRTLLAAGAVFASSVFAADQFALSLARFTESELVTGNTVTTSSLGTPTGLAGNASCAAAGLLRSNDLSWNSVPNAGGYAIERATGAGAFTLLTNVGATTYADTAVASGTYMYRVATTRSQWSSPVSASITLVQPGICL